MAATARFTKSATIANAAALSSAVDLRNLGASLVAVVVGPISSQAALDAQVWTAADIVFLASADGTAYGDLKNAQGTQMRLSGVTAGDWFALDPADFAGCSFLKLKSVAVGGTADANQGQAVTLSLVARSL